MEKSATLFLLLSLVVPLNSGLADEPTLKWPAAREAVRKYATTMQKAELEYDAAKRFATDTLLRDLAEAQTAATKAGNLEDANRIRSVLIRMQARETDRGIIGIWKVSFPGSASRLYRFDLNGSVHVKVAGKSEVITGKYRRDGGRWLMEDTFSNKAIYFASDRVFFEILEGANEGKIAIAEAVDTAD